MKGLETVILSSSLAAWSVGILAQIGILRWNLTFELELYPLYILAAFAGWFFGNVYVHRSGRERRFSGRALDEVILEVAHTRLLFVLYLFGPPGWLYLIRSMARREQLEEMPLVPILTFGVYAALFAVPVLLRGTAAPRRKLELGRRDD
ncbi:MAG: hypothetical protein OYL92_05910 [Acidobacteriota bacterium]|nr:hypothetical protein [Acidobacteriota bacterium]MDE2923613.1 hypothetical protein [Acidobacteriota bacterium]MDE3264493.1 hypothetical protein [Acidobacteriota bacterium]